MNVQQRKEIQQYLSGISIAVFTIFLVLKNVKGETQTQNESQWDCKLDENLCIYKSSTEVKYLDAFGTCTALGGRLPSLTELDQEPHVIQRLNDLHIKTSWTSVCNYDGRLHEFNKDTNSLAIYTGPFRRNLAFLLHIAWGRDCFALTEAPIGTEAWLTIRKSNYGLQGHKCNTELLFICIIDHANFNEMQRQLRLPLKEVKKIEIKKVAGAYPGKEDLCIPTFLEAYDNQKDRNFSIAWIIDGVHSREIGLKHGDHSVTLTVPNEHSNKYACEARYFGSPYGNRSQAIEIASPSISKFELIISVPSATFVSRVPYDKLTEQLKALNNGPVPINLTIVGDASHKRNGSTLLIIYTLVSDSFQGRELKDLLYFEEVVESVNVLLNVGNKDLKLLSNKEDRDIILRISKLANEGKLLKVQLVPVDRCPLRRKGPCYWSGRIGEVVQPICTGDKSAEMSLRNDGNPVTGTCKGSQHSVAEWVKSSSFEHPWAEADETTTRLVNVPGIPQDTRERHTSTADQSFAIWNLPKKETDVEPTNIISQEGPIDDPDTPVTAPNGSTNTPMDTGHGSNSGSGFSSSVITIIILVIIAGIVIAVIRCCFKSRCSSYRRSRYVVNKVNV